MTDQEIIQLIHADQSAGAKALWYAYKTKLDRHLIGKLRVNPDDVDDLSQQTFINVFKSIHAHKAERAASLWAWIKSIADNCFFDLYRKSGKKVGRTFISSDDLDDAGDAALLESQNILLKNQVEMRKNEIDIEKCVSEGLEKFADADKARSFALTLQMDGYSIEQIGIRIGRSAGATKQYLYEIRKKIEPYVANCFDLLKT